MDERKEDPEATAKEPKETRLARLMLAWGDKKQELDAIESEIKEIALEIGATQTVGKVRATFSNGRKTYDYEAAIKRYSQTYNIPLGVYKKHRKVTYNWREMCGELELEVSFIQSAPSVSVKLLP